jgi:Gpi18-like mannosyltransferase
MSKIGHFYKKNSWLFPVMLWLFSRLLIITTMLLIAPLLPAPPNGTIPQFGWQVFAAWDGEWYQKITTNGYEYLADGKQHNVAFFPLFPLIVSGVMALGLPFNVAATLVNNFAFLGALLLIFHWVEATSGSSAARWTVATLAWCPFSLYGTVTYTEGLFLLLTTAALKAFEKQQYASGALWGAMASATRVTGAMLVPTFLFVSWREGRNARAYLASLATSSGLLLFSGYCWRRFGDPLAFIHVQSAWGGSGGLAWQEWLVLVRQAIIGSIDTNTGAIKNPTQGLLFIGICAVALILWRLRQRLGSIKVGYVFCILWFLLWLLAGDRLLKLVMVFGGIFLLWHFRSQINRVVVVYGFFALALLLNAGRTISVDRYAYSIISLSIAMGLLLARYPRWGYLIMLFFALVSAIFAIRFSQQLWVA